MNKPSFIICGVQKSGTSALFNYLKHHPQCMSPQKKELKYFRNNVRRSRELIENEYGVYFEELDSEKLLYEATPTYLYDEGFLEYVSEINVEVKLIVILRDPIDRLISAYNYFRSTQMKLSQSMTFESYVGAQDIQLTDMVYHQLEYGKYKKYLEKLFSVTRSDRLLVVNYDEFLQEPKKVMTKICDYLDISPEYFQSYQFMRHNLTFKPRSGKLHKLIRRYVSGQIKSELLRKYLRSVYIKVNGVEINNVKLSKEMYEYLRRYYKDEYECYGHLWEK